MDTLAAISRWLGKQHVISWCVASDGELWCANAFYVYDSQNVAFYLLSDDSTRHGQMTGLRAKVAGTVNGQPKTVARIRGVQFKGEIRRLSGHEEETMSSNSPITRWGLAPSYTGYVTRIASESPHGRAESHISRILLLPRHPPLKG